jgi:hypothetical protein
MIRCVVQADVLNVMIVGSSFGFVHCSLKDRDANSPLNPGLRFSGMDEFGLNVCIIFIHGLALLL